MKEMCWRKEKGMVGSVIGAIQKTVLGTEIILLQNQATDGQKVNLSLFRCEEKEVQVGIIQQ
jgi:hypothetical protein